MIEITRTFDADFITHCVTSSWDATSDDGSPDAGLYFPPINDAVQWLRAEDFGVFCLHKQNHVMHEAHTILLPTAHGKAVEIGKAALEFAFKHCGAQRIVTNVPDFNHLALRLAHKVGFIKIGINKRSFCKNGILHDQTFLGISKEDICQ